MERAANPGFDEMYGALVLLNKQYQVTRQIGEGFREGEVSNRLKLAAGLLEEFAKRKTALEAELAAIPEANVSDRDAKNDEIEKVKADIDAITVERDRLVNQGRDIVGAPGDAANQPTANNEFVAGATSEGPYACPFPPPQKPDVKPTGGTAD